MVSFARIAIVVIRFASMRSLGHVLGPRVLFSLIRRLGKVTDKFYGTEGGRRLRTWNDGMMVGFGIDQDSDRAYSNAMKSPVL